MNKLVIISYLNFLQLKEKSQKILSESDNILVSISKEEFAELSDEKKKKLVGVALTDEKSNAEIIDTLMREELPSQNVEFFINKIKMIDTKVLEQSFKEKHKEYSKPYCPKKLINKNYNTKRKGGR